MSTAETRIEITVAGSPEAVRAVQGVHVALAELQRVGGMATQTLSRPPDAQQLDLFGARAVSLSRDLDDLTSAAGRGQEGLKKLVPPSTGEDLKKIKFGLKEVVQASEEISGRVALHLSAPLALAARGVVRAAVDLEQAGAGVAKTTDLAEPALDKLVADFRELSELPGRPGTEELLGIAEAAGQLGVKQGNLESFAKTIAALRVSTNLVGEEGTQDMARFANVMQTSQSEFGRLGSTIVALGNDGASTESEILSMGLRIAGAGHQIGLSESDVLGFANALSSVGIGAEAGGTAISRVMMEISKATAVGGARLDSLARVAGMTASEFKRSFEEDAAGTVVSFIEGLRRISDAGGNVFQILQGVEFQDIRVQQALLAAAGAGDLLRKSISLGSEAWRENNALTKEAEGFYNTTGGQLRAAGNTIKNVSAEIGTDFAPAVADAAKGVQVLLAPVREAAHLFGDLPEPIRETAAALVFLTIAAPPTIWYVTSLTGAVIKGAEALRKWRAARAGLTIATVGSEAVEGAAGVGVLAAGLSGVGEILAVGGAVLVGLSLVSKAFDDVGARAENAAKQASDSLAQIKSQLPQMTLEDVQTQQAKAQSGAKTLYPRVQEAYKSYQRLLNPDGSERQKGDLAYAEFLYAKQNYDALLAQYKVLLATAQADEAEIKRRLGIPGITVVAGGTSPVGGDAGPSLSSLPATGKTFKELFDRLQDAKKQVKELRVEVALGSDELAQLPAGSDAYTALEKKVKELKDSLQQARVEAQLLDTAVNRVGTEGAEDLIKKLGKTFSFADVADATFSGLLLKLAGTVTLPELAAPTIPGSKIVRTVQDPSRRNQSQARTLVDAARALHANPADLPADLATELTQALKTLGISQKQYLSDIRGGSAQLNQAGSIAVSALGAMAQAAVAGTDQMATVVINGFTQMAQAAAIKFAGEAAGPIWGAAIGAVGGLLGALFGSHSHQEPVPVKVDEYSSKALAQQKQPEGPQTVILQLIDPASGAVVGQQEYQLRRRERKDGVTRIPTGFSFPTG